MGPGMRLVDQVPQVLLIQGISTAWNVTVVHLLQLRQYGNLERLSYMIKSNTTNCSKAKVTECSWLSLQNQKFNQKSNALDMTGLNMGPVPNSLSFLNRTLPLLFPCSSVHSSHPEVCFGYFSSIQQICVDHLQCARHHPNAYSYFLFTF